MSLSGVGVIVVGSGALRTSCKRALPRVSRLGLARLHARRTLGGHRRCLGEAERGLGLRGLRGAGHRCLGWGASTRFFSTHGLHDSISLSGNISAQSHKKNACAPYNRTRRTAAECTRPRRLLRTSAAVTFGVVQHNGDASQCLEPTLIFAKGARNNAHDAHDAHDAQARGPRYEV